MSDNKIEAAQHQMNGAVEAFLGEIKTLKHQLHLMEQRAIDWEGMHFQEIENNNELKKQLEGAQAAIRDQVERNMKKPEVVLADRMDKTARELAHEEWLERRKWEKAEDVKRDVHNKHMQDQVSTQTELMKANAEQIRTQTANQALIIEMSRNHLHEARRQNDIFARIEMILNDLFKKTKSLPTGPMTL